MCAAIRGREVITMKNVPITRWFIDQADRPVEPTNQLTRQLASLRNTPHRVLCVTIFISFIFAECPHLQLLLFRPSRLLVVNAYAHAWNSVRMGKSMCRLQKKDDKCYIVLQTNKGNALHTKHNPHLR